MITRCGMEDPMMDALPNVCVACEDFRSRPHRSLKDSRFVESRPKFTEIGTLVYDMCMYFT